MEILSELTDLSLERNPSLDLKRKSLNLRNGDFELTQRMNSMLTVCSFKMRKDSKVREEEPVGHGAPFIH